MQSLIYQLQAEALDPKVGVTDLLRKALVVARKLKIAEMQNWIESEFSGYKFATSIPPYRKISGQVRAYNPIRGWIPVMFESPKEASRFSSRMCGQPIAEILSICTAKRSGNLEMPFSPEMENMLMSREPDPHLRFRPSLHVQHSAVHRIVDEVRNTVLSWSLKLEEDGIIGEGVTFSSIEIERAKRSTFNINLIFGNVTNSQIQQDTHNSSQTKKLSSSD